MSDFPMVGYLRECRVCKRKVLVEEAVNGVSHTIGLIAICWECLSEEEKEKAKTLYPYLFKDGAVA